MPDDHLANDESAWFAVLFVSAARGASGEGDLESWIERHSVNLELIRRGDTQDELVRGGKMNDGTNKRDKADNAFETPQHIPGEPGLYWRGGIIYARVRVDGETDLSAAPVPNKIAAARKVLAKWREDAVLRQHGIEPKQAALERNRLTVAAVLKGYVEFGFPDRKSRIKKTAATRRLRGNRSSDWKRSSGRAQR